MHVSFSRFQCSNLQFGSLLHSLINCLCYSAFVCKGFLSLTFAIHLQRTTVRPCIKLFIWFLPYVHKGSLFTCLFTKDAVLISRFVYKGRSPCLLLFICGPCVVVFILKGRCPFLCYSFAKDRRPCLMLFSCKGSRYLFCAINLQRKLLFLLSFHCPGKIRWTATLAKHGETASPSGFVEMAVTQIST